MTTQISSAVRRDRFELVILAVGFGLYGGIITILILFARMG